MYPNNVVSRAHDAADMEMKNAHHLPQHLFSTTLNTIKYSPGHLIARRMSDLIARAEGAVFSIHANHHPFIAPAKHNPFIAPPRPRAARRRIASCTYSSPRVQFDLDTCLPAPELSVPSKKLRGERRPRTSILAPPDYCHHRRQRTRRRHLPSPLVARPKIHPMTNAMQDGPPSSLPLGPLLGNLPAHLFQQEVLRRLAPTDLASLAGAGRGCAAAVAATALMTWAKRAKMTPTPGHLGLNLPPLRLKTAYSYAAGGGNLEVLEWLHNTGCPWVDEITCAAATGGHLKVLKWLHNHGCPWDRWTCAYAAGSGHLRMLQWARQHNCPWTWATPAFAAEGGHLAVLQWAREHGCPWDYYTCMLAAEAGQLEVLQWVRENNATGDVWSENRVRLWCAAGPREQEVLTWLDELIAP